MVQLPQENSIFTRTVRRAAGEDRLSHAVILTGRGDLTAAARFLAAAHVCEGTDRPCLRCRHCRKVLEGIHPDVIPVLDTEHKELTVEAVRALRKDVYIRPNEARRKVYVISDCRQLNQRDQDVLLKVVEAKKLLDSGKVDTVQDAAERTGISRSSFYKYKDDILPFHDNAKGKTITFILQMDDEPGLLSDVLKIIAEFHGNILTIHQTIPLNGVASLTISVDIAEDRGDASEMINEIESRQGVHYFKILGQES